MINGAVSLAAQIAGLPDAVAAAGLTFDRPWWLLALAAAAAPIVLARFSRRRQRRIAPLAVLAQCLAVALAAAALARPRAALGRKARLGYLLMVDGSGSVADQGRRAGRELAGHFPAGADVERFYFAEGLSRTPPTARDATRAAPALRMIAHRAGEGLSAAVVPTDGRFTDDDWPAVASAVAAAPCDIVLVPLDAPPPDARVAGLTARRRSPTTVEIEATVTANAPLRRTVVIWRGRGSARREVHRRQLALLPDAPATVRAADDLPADAAGEYGVTIDEAEAVEANNRAAVLVLPVHRRIALAGDDPEALRELLGPPGRQAGAFRLSELPDDPAGLAGFAGIVVCDPGGAGLSPAQRRGLSAYVRAGGGLVLIGTGPHGAPGDVDDPLNRVLPLVPDPFQRRPLHLLVLLDRSGSMSRPTAAGPGRAAQIKFDLAVEAVVALKDHLTARDALTVIAFADTAEAIYDSGPAAPDFAALRQELRSIRPEGPDTVVTTGLTKALAAPARAGRRGMLLVLSDLATETFDARAWADKLAAARLHLAVVAIGRAAATTAATGPAEAPPLEQLAKALEGAEYVRRGQLVGLAEVFARLVRGGRGEIVQEGPTKLQLTAALFDTGLTALPDLQAWLLAAERPGAEVLAQTAGGDAVLARRPAGLGRSVCLAVPLGTGRNASWWRSAEARALLPAAARWTLRSDNDPRFSAEIERAGPRLRIAVAAADAGRPIDELDLAAAVSAGDAERSVPLEQVAPGRYRGSIDAPPEAPAAVAVRTGDGATVWRGAAAATYPREYARLGADDDALRRLAERTGGRVVPASGLARALRESHARRLTELWPWLLGAALLLMLSEWCLTRVTRR